MWTQAAYRSGAPNKKAAERQLFYWRRIASGFFQTLVLREHEAARIVIELGLELVFGFERIRARSGRARIDLVEQALDIRVARVGIFESGIFLKMKDKKVQRGNFLQLINNRKRLTKFLGCIFIGLPIWFVIGILVTFSPEFAKALGVQDTIKAGNAIMYAYLGLALGDILTGFISNAFQSRKKVGFTS